MSGERITYDTDAVQTLDRLTVCHTEAHPGKVFMHQVCMGATMCAELTIDQARDLAAGLIAAADGAQRDRSRVGWP